MKNITKEEIIVKKQINLKPSETIFSILICPSSLDADIKRMIVLLMPKFANNKKNNKKVKVKG